MPLCIPPVTTPSPSCNSWGTAASAGPRPSLFPAPRSLPPAMRPPSIPGWKRAQRPQVRRLSAINELRADSCKRWRVRPARAPARSERRADHPSEPHAPRLGTIRPRLTRDFPRRCSPRVEPSCSALCLLGATQMIGSITPLRVGTRITGPIDAPTRPTSLSGRSTGADPGRWSAATSAVVCEATGGEGEAHGLLPPPPIERSVIAGTRRR